MTEEIDAMIDPIMHERVLIVRAQLRDYERAQLEDLIVTLCIRHHLYDEITAHVPARTPPAHDAPDTAVDDADRIVASAEQELEDTRP